MSEQLPVSVFKDQLRGRLILIFGDGPDDLEIVAAFMESFMGSLDKRRDFAHMIRLTDSQPADASTGTPKKKRWQTRILAPY